MPTADAVRLLSDAAMAAKRRAMPNMRGARDVAWTLMNVPTAGGTWLPQLRAYRSGVSGDATAEGAVDRLITRADPARAEGMDASTLSDAFADSADEISDWLSGAEATLAGPESAGILAEIAASDAGSLVIATGLTARAIVGIVPPPSTSGRDDADINAASKRASSIKFGFGIGATIVVIVAAIGLYLYLR